MSEQVKSLERWMAATAAAMRALCAYFPVREALSSAGEGERGRLSSKLFPCQKTDEKLCQGWTFISSELGLGARPAVLCPCARGQSTVLLPLLELASEFSEEFVFPVHQPSAANKSFIQAEHRSGFLFHILNWMHWAARAGFSARQEANWIDQFVGLPLAPTQRQALRWWVRLLELNQLMNNQVFTLLTRRGLQELYRQGQMVAVADGIERLGVTENSIIVLCLTGEPLKATGQHSQALAWFESLISCVDDFGLGLCLIATQPLLEAPSPESSFHRSMNTEYRWKVRRQAPEQVQSLERVLRKGSWDRLIESLARGDRLLSALGDSRR
jgi:hypothetical protein